MYDPVRNSTTFNQDREPSSVTATGYRCASTDHQEKRRLQTELRALTSHFGDFRARVQSELNELRDEIRSKDSVIEILQDDVEHCLGAASQLTRRLVALKEITQSYKQVLSELYQYMDCPICFEPMKDPRMLGCGHTFCSTCLRSTRCGVCRADRPSSPLIPMVIKQMVDVAESFISKNPGYETMEIDQI